MDSVLSYAAHPHPCFAVLSYVAHPHLCFAVLSYVAHPHPCFAVLLDIQLLECTERAGAHVEEVMQQLGHVR